MGDYKGVLKDTSGGTAQHVGMVPLALDIADFNEDDVPDVVVANNGDSTVSVVLSSP